MSSEAQSRQGKLLAVFAEIMISKFQDEEAET